VDVAHLVRQCRLADGLTQQQLAIRAGTTKTAISRLEAGRLSPTFDTVQSLLLCMGRRLEATAVPMTPSCDPAQLDAVSGMTPTQRLNHALVSQASLAGLLGAARDG
jgi:transcriptional regulator with XRE-family HTH domain